MNGCTQSETTIATNGGMVMYGGWNDAEGFFNTAAGVTGYGVSTDGGVTWTDGGGLPQTGGKVSGDPALAVCNNPDQVFMANLFFPTGAVNADLSVHTGTRSGSTVIWGAPKNVTNSTSFFDDKVYLICDRTNNNLYMSYTRFGSNGQIEFRRSIDSNVTWGTAVVLQTEEGATVNQGSYPATGPNGEVCVAWVRGWLTQQIPEIRMRCSTDQGLTFGASTIIGTFTSNAFSLIQPLGYNRGRILEAPSLSFDNSNGPNRGKVYVVWQGAVGGKYDVILKSCTLTGNVPTCGAAVTVNDTPGGVADDFFPWVNVDPNGNVGVLWYSNTGGVTDVYIDVSPNGGTGVDQRVTDVSTNWSAVATDVTPNFGDYINLASSSLGFHALWADGRNGDPDVYYATITGDVPPPQGIQGTVLGVNPVRRVTCRNRTLGTSVTGTAGLDWDCGALVANPGNTITVTLNGTATGAAMSGTVAGLSPVTSVSCRNQTLGTSSVGTAATNWDCGGLVANAGNRVVATITGTAQ